jgi:hypothetical protein
MMRKRKTTENPIVGEDICDVSAISRCLLSGEVDGEGRRSLEGRTIARVKSIEGEIECSGTSICKNN